MATSRPSSAAGGSSTLGATPDSSRSASSMKSGTRPGSNCCAGVLAQLVEGLLHRAGRPVGAAADDGVEGVGERDDAGAERDALALQAVGIAGAVPALVVVADDGREVARHAQRVADALADLGVLAHDPELVLGQRPGLVQDVLGDADLADVVEQRAVGHALQLAVAQAHVGGQAGRAVGQVAAVVLEAEVLGLDRVGEGDDDVVRLLHAPDDLARPIGAAQAGQQLDLLEGLGHEVVGARIEGRDHVRGRGVRGEHDDGQRHRARVGAQAPADLEAVHAGQASGRG